MASKEVLLEVLKMIESLEKDWDGCNSPKFSKKICDDVKDIINFFPYCAFYCNPWIFPSLGGKGLNLELGKNNKKIEIKILKNKIEYIKKENDNEVEKNIFLIEEKEIKELIEWLIGD